MDFKLAKEIYASAWHIDPITFQSYSKLLEDFRSGLVLDKNAPKANMFGILDKANVFDATRISRMDDVPEGTIAVYNFDSVITKHGGMSHYGTTEIAAQFAKMEATENVIGHIFKIESGGGSANAIKYIRDVSSKANRIKPLVTYAEDIMASAAMYIASDSDYIFANHKDALIGSIGTMIQFDGYKANTEDSNGVRHIRVYASQSVNKNKDFEEALNNFNFEPIQKAMLDPHAQEFINDMKANRPNMTKEQGTGAIYNAIDVVGTLIDGIGNMSDAVEKVKELSDVNNTNINLNSKNNSMDAEQLKAERQKGYAEGVTAEKDRVDTWMAFNDVAPEKVKAGIESGKEMTRAEEINFMRASQRAEMQNGLESASAEDVTPDKGLGAVLTGKEEETAEAKAYADEMLPKVEEE